MQTLKVALENMGVKRQRVQMPEKQWEGKKKKDIDILTTWKKGALSVLPQCSKTSLLKGSAEPSSLSTHWIKENTESTKIL